MYMYTLICMKHRGCVFPSRQPLLLCFFNEVLHINKYTPRCICVCFYAYIGRCTCASIYIYICIRTSTYTYSDRHACMHTYSCMYIYIFTLIYMHMYQYPYTFWISIASCAKVLTELPSPLHVENAERWPTETRGGDGILCCAARPGLQNHRFSWSCC